MRLLLILTVLLLATGVQAERWPYAPLPSPDANGDFSGDSFNEMWKVVDPDPKGLNARQVIQGKGYKEIASPKVGTSFRDLKVVTQLPRDTELRLVKKLKDDRNKPWLVVETYPREKNERYLLVRAHKDFIVPVHGAWPKTDENGNYYHLKTHRHWEVVDADPQGLNGRQHPKYPKRLGDSSSVWPTTTPDTWPVVTQLKKGTKLIARSGHLGIISQKGKDGSPWLLVTRMSDYKVKSRSNPPMFFVRAHQSFIKPIE